MDKEKMNRTPVTRLILHMSIPTVFAMFCMSGYQLVDTFFTSKLGTQATGVIGIFFAVNSVFQAVGFTIGMGAGNRVSNARGKGEDEEARDVSWCAVFLGVVLAAVLTLAGELFLEPLTGLLGATDSMMEQALLYGRWFLPTAIPMIVSNIISFLLRGEGKAIPAMWGSVAGYVLSALLCPMLIKKWGMIGGAAAFLTGQVVSLLVLSILYFKSVEYHHPGKIIRKILFQMKLYRDILQYGVPSLIRQGFVCVSTILLNRSFHSYGDSAVAAFSIANKIFLFFYTLLIGLGQGFQPVMGYCNGKRQPEKMKKAFVFTSIVGTLSITVCAFIMYYSALPVLQFALPEDAKAQILGVKMLRALAIVLPTTALGVICNMTYQAIGKSVSACILTGMRQGIFFLPMIYLLPKYWDLAGLIWVQPAADLLTFLACIVYAQHFTRRQR